ncbi:MAG: FGGY family carbohydrate kinase, partial [Sphingomonadales bacterium]
MTEPSGPLILSIDAGTTSTRAMVFDLAGGVREQARHEITQHYPASDYPASGRVEHDAAEIWAKTEQAIRTVLDRVGGGVAAVGITNQRETCLIWDRGTGKPLAPAIVWQDRR